MGGERANTNGIREPGDEIGGRDMWRFRLVDHSNTNSVDNLR